MQIKPVDSQSDFQSKVIQPEVLNNEPVREDLVKELPEPERLVS